MPTARLHVAARLSAAIVSVVSVLSVVSAAHAATVQDVCASAPAGQVRCDAQILVSGRKAKPVHPKRIKTGTRALAAQHVVTVPVHTEPQAGSPLYLQQAYDLTALSATNGGNDTIAVVDAYNDPSAAADLSTFRADSGLPACTTASGCFQVLNQSGVAAPLPADNTGWSVEESLDLDAVSSLCPNCRIVLVETNSAGNQDMQAGIAAAVGAGATIVSNSWSADAATDPFTSDLSFPGVSILGASGDDGTLPPGESAYPAALANVTAVGGTDLSATTTNSRGFTESAWSGGGSGCDPTQSAPAWQPQTGCVGRAYNDISADGDPNTGLDIYDSQDGGWMVVGGTSLATPLAAAYEAVTGVNGTTPQWAYTDEPLLNSVASGSDGSCDTALICNAGLGWNGPAGAGSISGDVVQGAPGIGGPDESGATTYTQLVTGTNATLRGGIYPNGETTSYYWQYGKTGAYGRHTAAVTVPAGTAAVTVPGALAALAPATTYHYRLVATNASGTSYGYDFTLTTAGAKPHKAVKKVARHVKAKPARARRGKASKSRKRSVPRG